MKLYGVETEKPGHLWTVRKIEEDKMSYDISHEQRLRLYDAYLYARVKDKPFNVLVRYKFLREGTKADVKNIREVSQYIRVQMHNWNLESNQIWSRHVAWGSDLEEACILLHLPQEKIKSFIDLVIGRRDGMEVHVVGYGEDFEYQGQNVNVLQYMCRNASNETVCKDLSTYCERSDYMYGYRTWFTWNLKPKNRDGYTPAYSGDYKHSEI